MLYKNASLFLPTTNKSFSLDYRSNTFSIYYLHYSNQTTHALALVDFLRDRRNVGRSLHDILNI